MQSTTPKLDAALNELAGNLRRIDAEVVRSVTADASLESRMRATLFRARIHRTIKELELSQCKTSS